MLDRPGYLQPITSGRKWLQLVLKSDLDYITKVVATVVESSCTYQSKYAMQLSSISDYSISRMIDTNQTEVQDQLQILFENGWLFDTGTTIGAKKVYALTFSMLPKETRK